MDEILKKVKEQLMEKLTQEQELSLEDLQKILDMAVKFEEREFYKKRAEVDFEMLKQRCQ